jgi:hypothetical protein
MFDGAGVGSMSADLTRTWGKSYFCWKLQATTQPIHVYWTSGSLQLPTLAIVLPSLFPTTLAVIAIALYVAVACLPPLLPSPLLLPPLPLYCPLHHLPLLSLLPLPSLLLLLAHCCPYPLCLPPPAVGEHTKITKEKGRQDRSPCCVSWADETGVSHVTCKQVDKRYPKIGPPGQTTLTKDMQETGPRGKHHVGKRYWCLLHSIF